MIDFWRADDLPNADPRYWGLTVSQYIGLGLVVAGLVVLRYLFKRRPAAGLFPEQVKKDHAT
jgi:hypothetical protein